MTYVAEPYDQLADYEPMNDYEDQMDGLQLGIYQRDDLYCKHGTFVGNWAGPDYMCGPCEMGVTDEEWIESIGYRAGYEKRRSLAKQMVDEIVAIPDQGIRTLAFLAWLQTKDWSYAL